MVFKQKIRFHEEMTFTKKLLRFDWFLLFFIFLLCVIGVGTLFSAAGGSLYPWALKHFYRCCFGFLLIFLIGFTNPKLIFKYSYLVFACCVLSLVYVEFFGAGDVKRWIDLKLLYIQPSELTKIALILFLAKYFSDFPVKQNSFIYYIIPFAVVLLPTLLVMNQPDLGTGFMIFLLGILLIFIVGLPWKVVFSILIVSLASVPILWQQLYEYQKHRIIVFLNPQIDALGSGYQIMQSKIAIGSGGLMGKGYLLGTQNKLEYLPEKHTDFAFTLIAEEMGFIGSIVVLLLFFLLIFFIYKNFFEESNLSNKIIINGVAILFFLYVSLNIGMVSGLVPVVGAPLPFISHGGTSLLTVFFGIGLVQSIRVYRNN